MDLNKIKHYKAGPARKIKEFAINMPLVELGGELHVLFELRSNKIVTQPGEICLPGGAVEEGEGFLEAALRETVEELGVAKENIEYIADLDYILDFPLKVVRPFLTRLNISGIEELPYEEAEVAELFTVPLSFFRENKASEYPVFTGTRPGEDFPFELIPHGRDYNWGQYKRMISFYLYEDRIIWGLTANIIRRSIEIFEELGVFEA